MADDFPTLSTPDPQAMEQSLVSDYSSGGMPAIPAAQGGTPADPSALSDMPGGFAPNPAAQTVAATSANTAADQRITASEDKLMAQLKGLEATEQKDVAQLTAEQKAGTAASVDIIDKSAAQVQARLDAQDQRADQAQALQMKKAEALQTMDAKLTDWANNTPTRQAAYATTMHLAPQLAILSAIGGALTRSGGLAMLQATNGMISGLNAAGENRYTDSMNQWKAQYDAMKEHQANMEKVFDTMTEAYKGRADAEDKAIERTRALTGDKLSAQQLKMGTSLQLWNAQRQVVNDTAQHMLAFQKIEEARANRAAKAQADAALSQDSKMMMAYQLLNGEDPYKVFAGGGRGPQAAKDRDDVINMVPQLFAQEHAGEPQYQGPQGQELLHHDAAQALMKARSETAAIRRAELQASVLSGRVEYASKILENTIPLARNASNNVPRGDWVDYNRLQQNVESRSSWSPQLQKFYNYTRTILNDYNGIASRYGSSALPDREKNEKMLSTATNNDVYQSALDAIQDEINAARAGGLGAMQYGAWSEVRGGPPATPPTTNTPVQGGGGGAPGAGWGKAEVVPNAP